MRGKLGLLGLFLALCCLTTLAAEPPVLIHVARQQAGDLERMLDAGLPVVMETNAGLFVEGSPAHAAWLQAEGFAFEILDRQVEGFDFLQIGLRPDSDRAAVDASGPLVYQEENWVLVKVPRGRVDLGLLEARVFTARWPHTPLARPDRRPTGVVPAEKGLLGPANPMIQKMVQAVLPADVDKYWVDLTTNPPTGTRYSKVQGARDAANYVRAEFDRLKLPSELHEYLTDYGPNTIGEKTGAIHPEQIYIVIGHLDDLPSSGEAPGADDNASGSVTVLEAARVMSCWAFRNTVRFVTVTGEEQGLVGSDYYAQRCKDRAEDVRGVVNMDMNGWEGDGIPNPENLDLNYNEPSTDLGLLFAQCATDYSTGLAVDAFLCPSLTASDHASFWERGYKAVCGITENEGYCGHGGNYPYYHQSSDTIAHCGSHNLFHGAIKTSIATLATLAEPFKIAFDRPVAACDGTLGLILGDGDLNTDPGTAQTASLEVWSTSEPEPETIVVTEETADSMLFHGVVRTASLPAVHGDGFLSVAPGDSVFARYVDAKDCDGSTSVPYEISVTTDCVTPVIKDVATQDITDTGAVVTWTTDEPADSQVVWGPAVPPVHTTRSADPVTAHSVNLTGLNSCTIYYFKVASADPAGNAVADDNGGQYFHFETFGNFDGEIQACHSGRIQFDRPAASCNDTLRVRLTDMDLNLSDTTADTVVVTVSSTSESLPEKLLLTETGPNTSRFEGTIPAGPGTVVAGDGRLVVVAGDLVTATYHDANDGTGNSNVAFGTAVIDCAAPAPNGVELRNITDSAAEVLYTTDESSTATIQWGSTPDLGFEKTDDVLSTSHTFKLEPLIACQRFYFRVRVTDAYGNSRLDDNGGLLYQFNAYKVPGIVFQDRFEGTVNWTLNGEWEIGAPKGLGSAPGDPATAFQGAKVLGYDLTGKGTYKGDYEPGLSAFQYAVSQAINASALTHGRLYLQAWLNCSRNSNATIDVLSKEGTWKNIYKTCTYFSETADRWSRLDLDISSYADGNSNLRLRLGQKSVAGDHKAGWNVDDLYIRDSSLPDFDACRNCAGSPSFGGLLHAEDVDPCAPGAIRLSWSAASAWGTGGTGTYIVYRDTTPNFTPGPGNLLAKGVSGTTYTDTTPPAGTTVYYLVRAENDETCASGPNNNGYVDANKVFLAALDSGSQPPPGAVGNTLIVALENSVNLNLAWQAGLQAARYHVLRSSSPGTGFVKYGETSGLKYQDVGAGANAGDLYYVVKGADACGNEEP